MTTPTTTTTNNDRAAFEAMIDRLVTLPPDRIRGILNSIPNPSEDVRIATEFFCNPKFKEFVSNTVWEIVK